MYLAVEIGGTKLQLAVGAEPGGRFRDLARLDVDPAGGAESIRRQIAAAGTPMLLRHPVRAVGLGFGGPVDADQGRTITSHQIQGWNDFPLVDWCEQTFRLPAVLVNDSDAAGLAEARFGAGRGERVVFYSNVGSGIGGALVIEGNLYRGGCGLASELGQMRPGIDCRSPERTVESLASGWAITAAARARIAECPDGDDAADLLRRCEQSPDRLTARVVAEAAKEGNRTASEVFAEACRAYGWSLAQMITLLAPNIVVLGGGVSLVGEELFLAPILAAIDCYVFPPLGRSFSVRLAALGEEVVLHGAMALAAERGM